MPQPVSSDVHVDTLLSNLLIAYQNMPDAFVADVIFPNVVVRKQSNLIPEIRKEDFFRDIAEIRAPGTRVKASGFGTVKDKTYNALNAATGILVDDETRDNQDDPFDVDDIATRLVSDRLKLRREKAFGTDFFKTGVWATDKVGITDFTQWDKFATSNPPNDVEDGKFTIEKSTGRVARKLVIGRSVWGKLKLHPILMERIKYTQKAVLTTDLVASLMEVEQLLVGRAVEATAAEGATQTFDFVFGKSALLIFVPDAPGLMVPSAGYTFVWNRPGRPGIAFIRRLREEREQADVIEGHTYFDQKSIGTDLGYFLSAAVA